MNTALNELKELERQSSAKYAPDVVLDTLEQMKNAPTPASSTESLSQLHGLLLRPTGMEPPMRRSTSSSSDTMSTFKPAVAPRMGVQLKPPALRPKPMVGIPKTGAAQYPAAPPQDPVDKPCTMWFIVGQTFRDKEDHCCQSQIYSGSYCQWTWWRFMFATFHSESGLKQI